MEYGMLIVNLLTVLIIWNAASWIKFPKLNAISFLALTIFMFLDVGEHGIFAFDRWFIRTIVGIPASLFFTYSLLTRDAIGKKVGSLALLVLLVPLHVILDQAGIARSLCL